MSDNPIDHAVFAELQQTMGSDFAGELVDTFLDEAPGMLAELKNAATLDEQDRFRRAAHSIKSNATLFGAAGLAELAREMEIGGLSGDRDTDSAKLAAVTAAFNRVATALRGLNDR